MSLYFILCFDSKIKINAEMKQTNKQNVIPISENYWNKKSIHYKNKKKK